MWQHPRDADVHLVTGQPTPADINTHSVQSQ